MTTYYLLFFGFVFVFSIVLFVALRDIKKIASFITDIYDNIERVAIENSRLDAKMEVLEDDLEETRKLIPTPQEKIKKKKTETPVDKQRGSAKKQSTRDESKKNKKDSK